MVSRSPEQNNRCPVASTPEVRPRRRRVYFARVLKVKVYDQAVNGWCPAVAIVSPFQLLARGCVCCFAPCFAFLVAAKESPGARCTRRTRGEAAARVHVHRQERCAPDWSHLSTDG